MNNQLEIKEFLNFIVAEAKKNNVDPEEYVKKLGKEGLKEAYKRFVASKKQKALHGAKLQYLKTLKHQCDEGEEVVYYKVGGTLGCDCKKKEDGGKVEKAEEGWKAKFKARKIQAGGKAKVEKNDTVHIKGKPYSIIYSDGLKKNPKSPYPKYTHQQYWKDVANKTDKEAQKRVKKVNRVTADEELKCGGKVKKHQEGGSLNGIPFIRKALYGIEKSDNTRVNKIPNNGEGVYKQMPINGWDFVPVVSTYREAQRLDKEDPNASKLGLATSLGMDLLGAGMIAPALKATVKASRLSKLLKSRGFNKITEQGLYRSLPNTYMRVAPKTIEHLYYRETIPTVRFKLVPTVDVSGVALLPLVQTLRVPTLAISH